MEGGRAHAAAARENCKSFEGADRCHLHVSAVHVAGKRGGGVVGEVGRERKMAVGGQTIDLLPYFNPKKLSKKNKTKKERKGTGSDFPDSLVNYQPAAK